MSAPTPSKKRGLGKGLNALITETPSYQPKPVEEAIGTGAVAEIDIELIETNPFQPRAVFDEQSLQELSDSIKELGIIQPITVRKIGDKFQLISGERRLRASKMAGLKKIPAFVRSTNDTEMLQLALVENIQREDLNPIEIAITYQRLLEEFSLTQEELSKKTGKGRSTISNYIRLLNLPAEIQAGLRAEKITMGHAKAISALPDKHSQITVFYKVLAGGLSVRQTEDMVKSILNPEDKSKKEKPQLPEKLQVYKDTLKNKLNTKVDIKLSKNGKGKLIIDFKNEEQIEKILQLLAKEE